MLPVQTEGHTRPALKSYRWSERAPATTDASANAPQAEQTTSAEESSVQEEQPLELTTIGGAPTPMRIGEFELFAEGDHRLRDSGCSAQMNWPRVVDPEDLNPGQLGGVSVHYSDLLSSIPADCTGIDARTLSLHISSYADKATAASSVTNHVTTNAAMYEELEPGVFCAQWANPRCMASSETIVYDGLLLAGRAPGPETMAELAALVGRLKATL
jgi:hypothetical protein